MKITVKRVFTAVTLVAGAITIYQVMNKPTPVAVPQSIEAAQANARSMAAATGLGSEAMG